jgi:hypothetical protein
MQESTKMNTKVFMIPFKQNVLKLAKVMSYDCTGQTRHHLELVDNDRSYRGSSYIGKMFPFIATIHSQTLSEIGWNKECTLKSSWQELQVAL